ncbi:MAG: hypothetical protein ABIQ44_15005, partial [Chloroflexia bacterium]
MIKLGVHRLEEYQSGKVLGLFGRLRRYLDGDRISFRLLRTEVPPSAKEVAVFEHISKEMRLASGVYRTTFRKRFAGLDHIVNKVLLEHSQKQESYE